MDKGFIRLVEIMDELREKCPWDKNQTIQTLRAMTLEEVYELTEAIDNNNWKELKGELGDLLLHVLFYARIAQDQKEFSIKDVIDSITKKLIKRHPHIYGNVIATDEESVKKNWQKIKLQEGNKSILSGVPNALPAVIKATRMQEKVKQVGFEWEKKEDVWKKVEEEIAELKEAIDLNKPESIEDEFGDVLFSLINYARFLKIDAEAALEKTNQKFLKRFQLMELAANEKGENLANMNLEEMDLIWNEVKNQNR